MTLLSIDALQNLPGGRLIPPGTRLHARYGGKDYRVDWERLQSGNIPPPNQRPDLATSVRYLNSNMPGWLPGDSALDLLPVELLCVGRRCEVAEYGSNGSPRYVVVADPDGDLSVWPDGSFAGQKVRARWAAQEEGGAGGRITLAGITEFRDRFSASETGDAAYFFDKLLKKPYPPTASLYVDAPSRLYGGPTPAVLHWSVSAGTSAITQVTVAGQVQPAGQTSGTVTTAATLNTGSSFALRVVASDGREANALAYVTYGNKRYWGVSGQDPLTLSDEALSNLLRGLSQEFSGSRQQEREFDCANQYIVYAWAEAVGAGNFYLNGLANTAFQSKVFPLDNGETGDGHLQNFRVSRCGSLLAGHFSSKVS